VWIDDDQSDANLRFVRLARSERHLIVMVLFGLGVLVGGSRASEKGAAAANPSNVALLGDQSIDEIIRAWRQALRPVTEREAVQMLLVLARGSDMGPGGGWFHPGKSRYGWDWLTRQHGATPAKSLAKDRFAGEKEWFDRLDRDADGSLTADDFDWSDKSKGLQAARQAQQWLRRIDGNSNGRITAAEWSKFFEQAATGKGYLTPDDLRTALFPPPSKEPGPSIWVLARGLFKQELGSFREGPDIDDLAPDFTLKTHDGRQTVHLSSYRGRMPVVLIFGSFT
jgi:hypothetical protein